MSSFICGLCGRTFKSEKSRTIHITYHDPQVKAKISRIHKGREFSESHKRNLSIASRKMYANHPEMKKRIAETHTGMKASEQARINMSKAQRARARSPQFIESQRQMMHKRWNDAEFRKKALAATSKNSFARADRIRRRKYGDEWADIYKYDAVKDVVMMMTLDLNRKPSWLDFHSMFGIDYCAFSNMVTRFGLQSYIEKRVYHSRSEDELLSFIKNLDNRAHHDDKIIHPMKIDILCEDIAFEFNGLYWHSVEGDPDGRGRLGYEQKKLDACMNKGVSLFTIWEDEWKRSKSIITRMVELIVSDRFDDYMSMLIDNGYAEIASRGLIVDKEKLPPLFCKMHGVDVVEETPPKKIVRKSFRKNGKSNTFTCWNCGYVTINYRA